MPKFQVGDAVRARVDMEPYYSGYAGSPKIIIPAGSIGYVKATDVPSVWRERISLVVVDFGGRVWRCGEQGKAFKREV